MSLQPLLDAPWVIQLHAFGAMFAFVLGIVQFAAPKGTLPHKNTRSHLDRPALVNRGEFYFHPPVAGAGLTVIAVVFVDSSAHAAHHLGARARGLVFGRAAVTR